MKTIQNILLASLFLGACFILFGILSNQSEHIGFGTLIGCISAFLLILVLCASKGIKQRINDVVNHYKFFDL